MVSKEAKEEKELRGFNYLLQKFTSIEIESLKDKKCWTLLQEVLNNLIENKMEISEIRFIEIVYQNKSVRLLNAGYIDNDFDQVWEVSWDVYWEQYWMS